MNEPRISAGRWVRMMAWMDAGNMLEGMPGALDNDLDDLAWSLRDALTESARLQKQVNDMLARDGDTIASFWAEHGHPCACRWVDDPEGVINLPEQVAECALHQRMRAAATRDDPE